MRGKPFAAVAAASALAASVTCAAATTFVVSDPTPAPVGSASSVPTEQARRQPPRVDLPAPADVPDPALAAVGVTPIARLVTPAVAIRTARLSRIAPHALRAYQRTEAVLAAAAPHCHLTWTLVAAVGEVVSRDGAAAGGALDVHGVMKPRYAGMPVRRRDGSLPPDTDGGEHDRDRVHDRPVGPMQLTPVSWALVGVDGDSNGRRNPYDIDDAALAVAVVLCAGGYDLSTPAGLRSGVAQVNSSDGFVAAVLAVARGYDRELAAAPQTVSQVVSQDQLPPYLAARPLVVVARPTAQETRAALDHYEASAGVPTGATTWEQTASPTTPTSTDEPTTSTSPSDVPTETPTPTPTGTPSETETATPTPTPTPTGPTIEPSGSSSSALER